MACNGIIIPQVYLDEYCWLSYRKFIQMSIADYHTASLFRWVLLIIIPQVYPEEYCWLSYRKFIQMGIADYRTASLSRWLWVLLIIIPQIYPDEYCWLSCRKFIQMSIALIIILQPMWCVLTLCTSQTALTNKINWLQIYLEQTQELLIGSWFSARLDA